MSNDYFSKFYELGYTHTELEALLSKLSNGEVLTKEQYEILMAAVGLVTNLTTFDGTYDSLKGKPDIVDVIKQSNEFVTFTVLDGRTNTIFKNLQQLAEKMISDLNFELSQTKADIDHKHDERYSLINHMHEGLYVTQQERQNDLKDLVTKDYLNSILSFIGPGGGENINPTYTQPKLSVKASETTAPHKQKTSVLITPTYTQNDAGEIISFSIRKNGEIIYEGTEIKNYSDEVTLKHDEFVTYTVAIEYGDGEIKNTAAGTPYPDGMIKAGTISAGITIKGRASAYYGVIEDKEFDISDIDNLSATKTTSRTFKYTYDLNNQKSVYMYPESYGKIASIKDANNFEYKNSYTLYNITYDDVKYNVYVLTDAVTVEDGFLQSFS